MKLTAQEIYDKLINEDKIKTVKGQIRFHLGDVSIIVKKKDVVGNILQEWLEGWLVARGIEFDPNPNTQMPPDVYLNPSDHTKNLLEVKAFNREVSPAFDIADFKAFVNELIDKPYHLDTDFLIFGYVMDEATGDVIVKDLWLKKLWEITKTMSNWPITVQYKNGILQKISCSRNILNTFSSYLLLKSILSPKCVFSVLQSLSPGVNLLIYHHSAETETHIYFIPKMAKSFDLLGFS